MADIPGSASPEEGLGGWGTGGFVIASLGICCLAYGRP